ncbi:MAG: sugar phosphate nucleotidyltransferase [Chloroflexota bacterium]
MTSWFEARPRVKCLVLCAGRGARVFPYSLERPKVLLEVGGRPILAYVIDYWRQYTDDFVFVVGYKKEQVIEFAGRLPIKAQFAEQAELKGIAHAIGCAREMLPGRFVVALGDCLCRGTFDFPPDMVQGVGVWPTENVAAIRLSYSVEIKDSLIHRVEEKPQRVPNNLCGLGYYFFDQRLFDYIREARPSALRNEIEITDVLQDMIDGREKLAPVFFRGDYLNVTSPDDLPRAARLMA